MELNNCFKKSYFDHIELGVDYDTFKKTWSPDKPLKKWEFDVEFEIFACIVKGAEFMFEYGKLIRVKISQIDEFFDEKWQNINNLTMNKCIQQWVEHGFKWEIYRLYTLDQLVILRCNDVIYEFKFRKKKFRLALVRFYEIDRFQDNRYLINHLKYENEKLRPESAADESVY